MTEKKTKALTLAQYETNAHSTIANSTQDHLDKVLTPELLGVLRRFVELARSIDNYKKAAFYGRNIATFPEVRQPMDRKDVPFQFIHGVLGLAGESGEVVELLLDVLEGKELPEGVDISDTIAEELGDVLWYLTIAAKANKPDEGVEGVARFNNKKLSDRWANKAEQSDFKT